MKISNAEIGSSFEDYFSDSVEAKGWAVTRIPDGCRQLNKFKIVRVKSPFDFLVTKAPGISFYCDTKSINGERFAYSSINQDQIKKLIAIERCGHVAGYVVFFRTINKFIFLSASQLSHVVPGASIKASNGIDLGNSINIEILFAQSEDALNKAQ
jgi:penicillin-binding protein-related factor A (putative recombinase)